METILTYIVKVNIALAVFYLLYMVLFRKDTFIKLRRFYFLSAIIFSLAYPLFTVSALSNLIDLTSQPVATETSVYIGEVTMGEIMFDDAEETGAPIDWAVVANKILLVGTLLLSLRFLWQLLSIIRIKLHSEKKSLFGYLFYHLKEEITPFSFFSWIFVNSETHNEKELKQILLHEHTHARQWHSLDILLVELLRIAFWWNPIVWLMKRDMTINLEYLADQAVLQEGVETKEYQYHLLQLTNHETAVQIVNNFNVSQLKQRIIMMNRNKTPMRSLAKYLSVLPLALLLITANSVYAQQNEPREEAAPPQEQEPIKKESKSDEVFIVVEKQPSFKGNVKAMMEFIEREMKYPIIAKETGIQGRVIVNYIVEKDGSISDVQIVRGVDPSLDKEAIRIVEAMPKWNPGLQRDERVRVKYTLPISFKLDENEDTPEMATASIKILKDKEGEEVIVRGYDSMNKASKETLQKKLGDGNPLIIVDDVKMEKGFRLNSITPTNIESITVLKEKSALEQYGEEGKGGVIVVTLKDRAKPPTTTGEIADSERKTEEEEIFVVVEDQPQFPGGMEALMKYLGENIKYPVEAQKNKIEGRVIVNFVVNKDGSLSDFKVVRGQDPLLDAEAIRVLSTMPNWKPGMQRGQAVNVRFTLPIVFRLKADEEVESDAIQKLKEKGPVTVYEEKDDKPDEGFLKYIAQTIKYPLIAQENGIMGVVRAVYDIDKKGEVSNIRITESVDPSLAAELERVAKLMPKDIALLRSGGKAASDVGISALFRLQGEGSVPPPPPPPVESDVVVVGYGKPVE